MARPKAPYDPTLKPKAEPYPCPELMAFWAAQPGGLEAMPPQVREYITGQNGGVFPGGGAEAPRVSESAPF